MTLHLARKISCVLMVSLSATAMTAFIPHTSIAEDGTTVSRVVITGNQRIEPQTIRSYLGLGEGVRTSRYDVDIALKRLYATGFFSDVNIRQDGDTLNVQVVENPIVNRVAFEGNKHVEDKDLEKEIELRPRTNYTRTRIQNDVKRILDIYRRAGRYSAQVNPKVITLEQNRVDVVFEISEGPVAKVEKIIFISNDSFTSSALESAIRTEQARWYKFFTDSDKYDPDRLLYDQDLLRKFYQSHGYADFQVKSAVAELTPNKDAFYITFTVEEGPVYNFGTIDVKSALRGVDSGELSQKLTTQASDTYNMDEVESSIDAITKRIGDDGYAFVDVDPQFTKHEDTRTVDVTYDIKESPRVYVERINITGNVRTLDQVIRREFRLAEGDPYSTSKLQRSEQRLNNLGYFEKVTVTNEPGSAPDKTVINVNVSEKSTGELSLGAGYSTLDGALTEVSLRESNLLGRGQDLKLRTMIATERQQFDISFTEPYFLDRELAAGIDVYKTLQDFRTESSFDRETNGFNLRAGYALTENLRHDVNYTLRETTISNIQSTASRFIKDQEGQTVTSEIGHAITYDTRDNRFDPTGGVFVKLDQDIAGLGGDSHYLRHQIHAGYYYPIAPKWTMSFLGEGGYIFGLGDKDVNIADRFFIGGQNLRGFDTAGIGPRDRFTRDALGGNVYYTTTAELKFPLGLPEDLGFMGAAFVDAGSLWSLDASGPEVVDDNSIRVSGGVGVAWASPFGPIRIDFAHAISKVDVDETQIFRFSFGTRF